MVWALIIATILGLFSEKNRKLKYYVKGRRRREKEIKRMNKVKNKDMNKETEFEKKEVKVENKDNKKNDKQNSKDTKKEVKNSKKDNKKESKSEAKAAEDEKILELEGALQSSKEDYIRLMAEFENFRRRKAEERIELISSAAAGTIEGLLPVLDDCQRALQVLEESDDSQAAKEGTELIYNKLLGYLKSKGLDEIEAVGKEFDTDFHEAVTQFPARNEDEKGKVVDVIQTGYTLNGKVLRYAKVVVGV